MPEFGATTTDDEAAQAFHDQIKGKTILTTGVSPSGLGATFVLTLSRHSPKLLILAGRDVAKCQQTAFAIASTSPGVATRILRLDLASQSQIRKAADEVNGYAENIDVLVNNAGVMASPYSTTEDGLETQFGVNHVGHFLFTNLITAKILKGEGGGRVVSVSSDGHRLSPIVWEDFGFSGGKTYDKWIAYGQGKTANMLFAVSLAEKLRSKGLQAYSLHPGVISTNLGRHMDADDFQGLVNLDKKLGNGQGSWTTEDWATNRKSLEQGVATHVVAAFDPNLADQNGAHLSDCRIPEPGEELPKAYAMDRSNAERLWDVSEGVVGQKFRY